MMILKPKTKQLSAYPLCWPRFHKVSLWSRKFQRASGLVLSIFAVWHIFQVVEAAKDPTRLGTMIGTLLHPFVLGLLLANLGFHTLNGIRMILFDWGLLEGGRRQLGILLAVLGTVILIVAGLIWRLQ